MPKPPKHDYTNPDPDFVRTVKLTRAAEIRGEEVRGRIRVLEEAVKDKLRSAPLNQHSRHEFKLEIKQNGEIVDQCTLSMRQNGTDLRMIYRGKRPVLIYKEKIKFLRAFLDENIKIQ